jgi:exonuclease SbcD
MSKKNFKFIHISDIHLGREITKKYTFLDPNQETRVRRSPVKVLDNLATLAEEEQVDFILIAGDTFDDDMPSSDNYFKKFKNFLKKIDQLDIDVYIVLGNHDVASDLLKSFESNKLPGNTFVFPAKKADTFINDNFKVAIHGQSYPKKVVTEKLVDKFPKPVGDFYNIGLIHTSYENTYKLDETHNYAPTNKDMLDKCEYDYWAFGHIHKREILINDPYTAVYSGNPQGLSTKPSETCNENSEGKGCYLVEVKDFESELTFKPLDDARFFTAIVEVRKDQDISEIVNNSIKKIESIQNVNPGIFLMITIELEGKSDYYNLILEDELLTSLNEELEYEDLNIIKCINKLKPSTKEDSLEAIEAILEELEGLDIDDLEKFINEVVFDHLTKKEFKKNLNKKFGNLPKSIPLTEQKFISEEIDEQKSSEVIINSKKIASRIINGLSYKDD